MTSYTSHYWSIKLYL